MEWSSTLRIFGAVWTALLVLLLWTASRPRRGPWWRWLPSTLAGVAAASFLWTLARWDLSSVYLRPLYPVLYAVALFAGLRRRAEETPSCHPRRRTAFAVAAAVLNTGLVVWLAPTSVAALRARATPDGAVALASPFAGGHFVVAQGGDDPSINHHAQVPAQRYAIDVNAVGPAGFSQRGWRRGTLEDYVAHGAPVVAPCAGTIRAVRDDQPDHLGTTAAPGHLAGNHVVIACDGVLVLLAHLAAGSVAVSLHQRVRTGDPIGAIGNSGNTTEPHLHLHVARHPNDPLAPDAEGVPFTIDGRFLVRGSRVPDTTAR